MPVYDNQPYTVKWCVKVGVTVRHITWLCPNPWSLTGVKGLQILLLSCFEIHMQGLLTCSLFLAEGTPCSLWTSHDLGLLSHRLFSPHTPMFFLKGVLMLNYFAPKNTFWFNFINMCYGHDRSMAPGMAITISPSVIWFFTFTSFAWIAMKFCTFTFSR